MDDASQPKTHGSHANLFLAAFPKRLIAWEKDEALGSRRYATDKRKA
jgi:hypothetical protein